MSPAESGVQRTSFDSYRDIFEQRGAVYHEAMLRYPRARDQEYRNVVDAADIRAHHLVCDVQSAGGYFRAYLPPGASVVQLDTSHVLAQKCRENGAGAALIGSLDALPFCHQAFDRVVNIAGLHHERDKSAFYREAARAIRSDGAFCFADVWRGSRVSRFLDEFVDRYSPMGHQGIYLDEGYKLDLERAGLAVEHESLRSYPWVFDTLHDLTSFVRLLFGLEGASHDAILRGVEGHLGVDSSAEGCSFEWQLFFVRSSRLE